MDWVDNDCAMKLRVRSRSWLWEDAMDATSFEQQESRPAFLLHDSLQCWGQEEAADAKLVKSGSGSGEDWKGRSQSGSEEMNSLTVKNGSCWIGPTTTDSGSP